MKARSGFISNSSSTAFIILNRAHQAKTLVDFVDENPHLIELYRERYGWGDVAKLTQEALRESAEARDLSLKPGANYCVFGDEQGDLVGQVFDYILRDGGRSKSFHWFFQEWLR